MNDQRYNNPNRDRGQRDQRSGYSGRDKTEDQFRADISRFFGDQYDQILLSEKKSYNAYIDKIKEYVDSKKEGWTTAQLRNIFSKVKKMKEPKELYLFRPKLAYASGRADKEQFKELLVLLDDTIKKVSTKTQLEEFKAFFESIVAYHKYFGGRES